LCGAFAKEHIDASKRAQAEDKLPLADQRRRDIDRLNDAADTLEALIKLPLSPEETARFKEELEAVRAYALLAEKLGVDKRICWGSKKLRSKITSHAPVKYTEEARASGLQGTVKLLVFFDADGSVEYILPLQDLGYGLTQQAIVAARTLKFVPPVQDGLPVSVIQKLEFTFSLY